MITSRPHTPQSNGLAEAYIRHANNLIIKDLEAGKPWFHSLHKYRSTPTANNLPSPLEEMTCQKPHTNLPTLPAVCDKCTEYLEALIQQQECKASHYRLGPQIPQLYPGQPVCV